MKLEERLIEIWKTGPNHLAIFIRGDLPLTQSLRQKLKIRNSYIVGHGDCHLSCKNTKQVIDIISKINGISENMLLRLISIPWTHHKVLRVTGSQNGSIRRI